MIQLLFVVDDKEDDFVTMINFKLPQKHAIIFVPKINLGAINCFKFSGQWKHTIQVQGWDPKRISYMLANASRFIHLSFAIKFFADSSEFKYIVKKAKCSLALKWEGNKTTCLKM